VLAAAAAGFLCWNFPPARIFMGDAGSGFLGLTLGTLLVADAHGAPRHFWMWLILLGVFIVDATVTLARRVASGKSPADAHRTHAYQHASRMAGSHRPVVFAVLAINVCWLAPCAYAAARGILAGPVALALAYVPLVAIAFRYRAGEPEHRA
jgi:Fuc2NAc and GlcNAc transferase